MANGDFQWLFITKYFFAAVVIVMNLDNNANSELSYTKKNNLSTSISKIWYLKVIVTCLGRVIFFRYSVLKLQMLPIAYLLVFPIDT